MNWTNLMAAGLVAMGTQWPVIDLPYPEVAEESGGGAWAAEPVEAQVERAICRHVHLRSPRSRGPDIAQLRIDGTRATAMVTTDARVEWVHLEAIGGEWRVVQTFAHR